jgi:chlorite dismutase
MNNVTSDIERTSTAERQYLKYTFFKLDPRWRHLTNRQRRSSKTRFTRLIEKLNNENLIQTYSLIGTRGDVDFLIWNINKSLEQLQSFASSLLKSELGKYLTILYSYLAITRPFEYLGGHHHEGQDGVALQLPERSKYLFVYPFTKIRHWYFLPHEERAIMMAQHFKIGHKYHSIRIHTGYSFGLDDQEFVLAFEADSPSDFSELIMELRSSDASRYTALETPIFTCVKMKMGEILNLLC